MFLFTVANNNIFTGADLIANLNGTPFVLGLIELSGMLNAYNVQSFAYLHGIRLTLISPV